MDKQQFETSLKRFAKLDHKAPRTTAEDVELLKIEDQFKLIGWMDSDGHWTDEVPDEEWQMIEDVLC